MYLECASPLFWHSSIHQVDLSSMSHPRNYCQYKTSLALHRGRNSIKKIDSSGQFDFHKFIEASAAHPASYWGANTIRTKKPIDDLSRTWNGRIFCFNNHQSTSQTYLQCRVHAVPLHTKLPWHRTVAETPSERLLHPENSISVTMHLWRTMLLTGMKTQWEERNPKITYQLHIHKPSWTWGARIRCFKSHQSFCFHHSSMFAIPVFCPKQGLAPQVVTFVFVLTHVLYIKCATASGLAFSAETLKCLGQGIWNIWQGKYGRPTRHAPWGHTAENKYATDVR